MSVSYIPCKTKQMLWGKAAGRCQFRGCNARLNIDDLTKVEFNQSYIAHIIADSPGGPRGDEFLSDKMKSDLSNLMLLCDRHHRLIDKEDVPGHPVELLMKMKSDHEKRIELQTDVQEDMGSHILLYGANIGAHSSPLNYAEARIALMPIRYPASEHPVEIGLKNSVTQDDTSHFWEVEIQNLRGHYQTKIKHLLDSGVVKHLSVFSLAPQPLLMELGRLIGDINKVDVFQRRREPTTWKWSDDDSDVTFLIERPEKLTATVALNISLSANIANERLITAAGDNLSIWKITIESPHNDFLKSKRQLSSFRFTIRKLLDEVKAAHGQNTELLVFPAMPASTAVELGRIWMPKADMPLHIYEQNTKKDGFYKAHIIKN